MNAGRFTVTSCVFFASALIPSIAIASDDTPEELAKIYACRAIEDDVQRLACFDDSVEFLQTAEEAGTVIALSKDSIEATRQQGFGLDLSGLTRLGGIFGSSDKADKKPNDLASSDEVAGEVELDKDGEVKRVTYRISQADRIGNGRYRIELENGQVWQTTESEPLTFRNSRNGGVDTAVIRRAFGGSFLVRINDSGRSVRIRRVK